MLVTRQKAVNYEHLNEVLLHELVSILTLDAQLPCGVSLFPVLSSLKQKHWGFGVGVQC